MNFKAPTYRICAVTGDKFIKSDLFRIVKTKSGDIYLDEKQNIMGRGAYIKKDINVILLGKKRNSLSKALRCKVPESIYDSMISILERK